MNKSYSIPVIKENNISKLIDVLNCFNEHPYNREKQKNCVLGLYDNKSEKSVFRGMAIPSLRYLGLIIGYGDLIRPSANGKLILEGRKKGKEEALRVAGVIILELDREKFGFTQKLKQLTESIEIINKKDYIKLISPEIKAPSEKIKALSEKQKKERVDRWIRLLSDLRLIQSKNKGKHIMLHKENLQQLGKELEISSKSSRFKCILFEEYGSLPYLETAGIVDIALLRELVAMHFYKKYGMILTEFQFDELLSKLSFVTESYIISLGHTMGAEEKLFHYDGEYYRTLSIRFLRGR